MLLELSVTPVPEDRTAKCLLLRMVKLSNRNNLCIPQMEGRILEPQ
jgi:hypothetical protein